MTCTLYTNYKNEKVNWDPSNFLQDAGKTCKKKQLFQYTTKIGRNIIQHQGIHKVALVSKWREEGLDDSCMQAYWRKLWVANLPKK